MAISVSDLDALVGYDPVTHTHGALPTMRPATSVPSAAPTLEAPNVQYAAPTGLPSMFSPAAPTLQKPQESFWQKLGHGLETAGNVAGNIVAPGVMRNIPGTQLHNEFEEARKARLAGEEAHTGLEQAQASEAQGRTWQVMHPGEAKTAELSAEQRFKQEAAEGMGLKPGTPEYNAYMGVPQVVGKTPEERAYDALISQGVSPEEALKQVKTAGNLSGKTPQEQTYASLIASGMSPQDALAAVTKTPPTNEAQEDQRYENIRSAQAQGKPVSADDLAWAKAYEQRKALGPQATVAAQAPTKATERSDKSYQYNSTALEKEAAPIEALNQRMSKLNDALAQGNMQADALVAPELLSVMAGGAGTGLRMNEAEISRIVGGRTNWESLKAAAQKWSLDPNSARSITPDQDKQIRALVKTVQDRLTRKMAIIDQSRQSLLEADDPKEHRKIVTDAKRSIDAIDSARNVPQSFTENQIEQIAKNEKVSVDEVKRQMKAQGIGVAP